MTLQERLSLEDIYGDAMELFHQNKPEIEIVPATKLLKEEKHGRKADTGRKG